MRQLVKRVWTDDSGAELTEYALTIGIVALGLIAVLVVFRGKIAALFARMGEALDGA